MKQGESPIYELQDLKHYVCYLRNLLISVWICDKFLDLKGIVIDEKNYLVP